MATNGLLRQVALVSDSASVSFGQISTVAAALQKQAAQHFGPLWNVNATVSAFDKLESVPVDYWPVIVRDDINQPGAAGFHSDEQGQPFSLVQADSTWSVTASHETMEMLADPSGNRTMAGPPPQQAPASIKKLSRVLYLVEVADPCEEVTYTVNGVNVSDFITPHFYDTVTNSGVQYSFEGSVKAPHQVLEGGYISFSNPLDNEWYQIIVQNGKAELRSLGKISAKGGKSLREVVDGHVREIRKKEHYRTRKAATAEAMAAVASAGEDTSTARAGKLREFIRTL